MNLHRLNRNKYSFFLGSLVSSRCDDEGLSLWLFELVALSDSSNQALHIRHFIIGQGHACGPVTVYQDNMSCMSLVERGRSAAERTRHIAIKYFWLKERVGQGEARVKHLGTKEMYTNLLTKPSQGAQFKCERQGLTGWDGKTSI